MEKPPRSKGGNVFKYLPRATTFTIPKRPYSPGRDNNKGFSGQAKGFSGPMFHIVPEAARTKSGARAFEAQAEPMSPTISCIGQIKNKKSCSKKKKSLRPPEKLEQRRPSFTIRKMFRRKARRAEETAAEGPVRGPALGEMRRFRSGREALTGFDWRDVGRFEKDSSDDDDEEEVIIPFSAPILLGSGGGGILAVEPKKEVNIWKRTLPQPPVLQLGT